MDLLLAATVVRPGAAADVVSRADVVTEAMTAHSDNDDATRSGIRLLGAAAIIVDGARTLSQAARAALVPPAVVRATVRVLRSRELEDVKCGADLLSFAPRSSASALRGVAAALMGAATAHADRGVHVSVSAALLWLCTPEDDVAEALCAEARAAGGLMAFTAALRGLLNARGESAVADVDDFRTVASAAAAVALSRSADGGADEDAALQAGAAVAVLALARRHMDDEDAVAHVFRFLGALTSSPAWRAALASAGILSVAVAALRTHHGHAQAHMLVTLSKVLHDSDSALCSSFGDAGLLELAAQALTDSNHVDVESAAVIVLGNACCNSPANQARAVAAGLPVALTELVRARLADAAAAGRAARALRRKSQSCAAAAAAARGAGALRVLADLMLAHSDDAEAHGSAGAALGAVLAATPVELRASALAENALGQALSAALDAGLCRHGSSSGAVNGMTRAALSLCHLGATVPPHLMGALVQAAPPGASADVLLDMYDVITPAVTQYRKAGAVFTAPQLAVVLETVRRHAADAELVSKALAAITAHVTFDASVAASPLVEEAMAAAVAASAVARKAEDVTLVRQAAAMLFAMTTAHGEDVAAAAAAAATRAGLQPVVDNGAPYSATQPWEIDIAPIWGVLLARLRAGTAAHDAAACSASVMCARCAQLRASGKRCGLPGCGAERRAEDAERTMAKCSGCRRVAYCSAAHQKQDWARHKGGCRAAAAAAQQAAADNTEN